MDNLSTYKNSELEWLLLFSFFAFKGPLYLKAISLCSFIYLKDIKREVAKPKGGLLSVRFSCFYVPYMKSDIN